MKSTSQKNMNRRELLKISGLGFASAGLSGLSALTLLKNQKGWAKAETEPHFFIDIYLPGAWDVSYLFDARPKSLTEAGLIQNYRSEESIPFEGKNGTRALRSRIPEVLGSLLANFSIINGVHMASGFDGHDQSANVAFTGNAFGGDSYIPWINSLGIQKPAPLDYLKVGVGNFLATINNSANSAKLGSTDLVQILNSLNAQANYLKSKNLANFKTTQLNEIISMRNAFARTAVAMDNSEDLSKKLFDALSEMEFNPTATTSNSSDPFAQLEDPIEDSAKLIAGFLKFGLTRSAIYTFHTDLSRDRNLDAHDVQDAKRHEEILKECFADIKTLLNTFKNTDFDGHRSLYEVCTFLIHSEFSRTTRQVGQPIDNTGTDHNALTNTVMIGGKGIKAGLLLGATDLQDKEDFENPGAAHREIDPEVLRFMGRPYDFKKNIALSPSTGSFTASDYLNFSSISNTVLKLFGVKEASWLSLRRGENPAPPLDILLG